MSGTVLIIIAASAVVLFGIGFGFGFAQGRSREYYDKVFKKGVEAQKKEQKGQIDVGDLATVLKAIPHTVIEQSPHQH
jgi:hypothetical protein